MVSVLFPGISFPPQERAAQAVAEAAASSVFVEQRRWKVIQLAGNGCLELEHGVCLGVCHPEGWGDVQLKSGRPLWSIDKEGCCVWMSVAWHHGQCDTIDLQVSNNNVAASNFRTEPSMPAQALGGLAHDVLKHYLDSTKAV